MGVRMAFSLGNGEWLEIRRLSEDMFMIYVASEHINVADRTLRILDEKELGSKLLEIFSSQKE